MRILYRLLDIINMLLWSFLQLLGAMLFRPFSQEIDYLSATFCNPIDRLSSIHESEDLYPIQHISVLGIPAHHSHCLLFSLTDSR